MMQRKRPGTRWRPVIGPHTEGARGAGAWARSPRAESRTGRGLLVRRAGASGAVGRGLRAESSAPNTVGGARGGGSLTREGGGVVALAR